MNSTRQKIYYLILIVINLFFLQLKSLGNPSNSNNNSWNNNSNQAVLPGYFNILKNQQEKEKKDKEEAVSKEKKDNSIEIKHDVQNERYSKKNISEHAIIYLSKIFRDPILNKEKLTLKSEHANIRDILELLSKGTGIDFVIDFDVQGTTSKLSFKEVTLGYILNYILSHNQKPLALIRDMNVWRIMTRENAEEYIKFFEHDHIISKVIDINYATINDKFRDLLQIAWTNIIGHYKTVSSLYIDEERRQIFIRGYPKKIKEFQAFLKDVDKVVTQIKIDAIILFAHKDYDFDFGINWSGIYNRENCIKKEKKSFDFVGLGGRLLDFPEPTKPIAPRFGDLFVDPTNFAINLFTRACLPSSSSFSNEGKHDHHGGRHHDKTFITLPFVFGGPDLNLKRLNLLLNAAESENKVKIMSRPSLMTSDNEVAKILIGESIPLQATAIDVLAVAVQNITSINFKDIGIALEVFPRVSPDKRNIKLEIFVEESKIISGTTVTNEKGIMQNPPVIDVIKVQNKVNLKNGQTVVIGGLSRCHERKCTNRVPVLSRIPLIGNALFSATSELKDEFEQFIFITPTIVSS